VITTEKLGQQK